MKTKTINGVEHYQLGVTEEWVPTHSVPELQRGLHFYSTMCPAPLFIVESNVENRRGRVSPTLPGGIPDENEVGEYYLVYTPSSGSEPLRWRRGDNIREQFKAGQYSTDPTEMATDFDENSDNEPWWRPIVKNDMTDYDFIDPDQPAKQAETSDDNDYKIPELMRSIQDSIDEEEGPLVNNNSNVNTDNPAEDKSLITTVKSYIGGFF